MIMITITINNSTIIEIGNTLEKIIESSTREAKIKGREANLDL